MTTFTTPAAAGQKYRGSNASSLWSEVQNFHKDRQILSGSAASVSFTVPAGLRNLTVTWTARTDAAVATQLAFFTINGDSSALYTYTYSQVTNTTPTGSGNRSQTSAFYGSINGASATAGLAGTGTIFFQNWDSSTFGLGYTFTNEAMGAAAASQIYTTGGGVYLSTSARTSITFLPGSGNFIAGTDFQLYGLIT